MQLSLALKFNLNLKYSIMKTKALHYFAVAILLLFNCSVSTAGIGFGDQQSIDFPNNNGYTAIAADFDNDGSIDVLSVSNQHIKWHKNDGKGRFISEHFISNLPQNNLQILATDLDNDGNVDLLLNNLYGNIEWLKNTGNGIFDASITIGPNSSSYNMAVADVDNNGSLDIVVSVFSLNRIIWFKNNGNTQFDGARIIATDIINPWVVKTVDFDNDGKMDILANSLIEKSIVWYKNLGNEAFSSKNVLATSLLNPEHVYSFDINLDGNMDIVAGSWTDSRIVWFENDGNGNFGIEQVITTETQGLYAINAADLDNDGDLDILTGSVIGNKLSWNENYNNQTFGAQHLISQSVSAPHIILSEDLDNDFDLDIITASAFGTGVYWFSNTKDYVGNGIVFFDVNRNGIQDGDEQGIGNQKINISPSNQLTTTHVQGNFQFTEQRDTVYEVSWVNDANWQLTTGSESMNLALPNNNNTPIAFGLFTQNLVHNIQPSITSLSTRCNSTVPFYIIIANEGTAIENGKAELIIEDNAGIINYQPANINVNGNTATWDVNTLWPGNKQQVTMNMAIPMPEFVGDSIKMTLNVYSTALDGSYIDTFTFRYAAVISCAYDPNDKQVMPNGIDEPHYTLIENDLSYTVRFQNVGNDYAFDVNVVDTIDANLDLSTLTIVGTSHTMRTKIDPASRKVEFIFEDIMLPDSSRDEPGSHGYIFYQINAFEGTLPFTRVENTAHIFFDQNPAIVTNTTYNTLVDVIPDSLAPTALCAADTINLFLDADGYTTLRSQQINLNSFDNIGIHQFQLDRNNFSCNDIGLQEVTLSIYDYAYNSDQCTAIVRIADVIAPRLICKTANFEIANGEQITVKPYDVIQDLVENCLAPNIVLSATEFTAADAGNQTIYITAEDASGNITHDTTSINISIPTAVNELSSLALITVYPNPFFETAYLNIKTVLTEPISVYIQDVTGKIVREYANINSNQLEIERGSLSKGMYFIVVDFQQANTNSEVIQLLLQ
jgi:hypothetical protein